MFFRNVFEYFFDIIIYIFYSTPQSILQISYLVLNDSESIDYIVLSSLFLSIISVAQRFTSDDSIFFKKEKGGELLFEWSKLKKFKKDFVSYAFIM